MADNVKEAEASYQQLKRDLTHLRIEKVGGPEITVGDTVFKFKKKAPVAALASLIGTDNQVEAMLDYIRHCLTPDLDQEAALAQIAEELDVEGLGEFINVLSEAYTPFPEKS